MKRLIAFISILMLVSSAYGTATSVTIYGTNKSNAQSNVTCYGCNNTISVQAWNTSYVKNISVHSRNGSGGDVISFNISNVTGYRVQELKVNGTVINAYQAGANGMLNFTYTVVGNRTLVLSPALNANGYNSTWGYFWNLIGFGNVGIRTTTPNDALEVAGYIRTSGSDPVLRFRETDETDKNWQFVGTGGRLRIENASDDFATTTTRIQFDNNGNVGIGTTTPATKLDVNGVISGNGSGLSGLNASNVSVFSNQRNNVSLGRGLNTVYQNTNSTTRFVSVRISSNGATGSLTFYADSANPPTTSVSYLDTGNDNYANTFAVLVLPNHYYSITQTSSPVLTIRSWSEWT